MAKNSEGDGDKNAAAPILIKKYPNRRLYNTSTSAYIVLDDIVKLVKDGTAFVIQDTKTGDDITRSILNQIIFERETKPSNYHFPLEVQKQLIGMYDDAYSQMVPDYLRESMNLFEAERERMSEAVESAIGRNTRAMVEFSQNIARQNAEIFRRSFEMFGGGMMMNRSGDEEPGSAADETSAQDREPQHEASSAQELEEIQNQINQLQERLKSLK